MPLPVKQLPPRSKVKIADTWDLSSLFPDDDAWEEAFTAWEKQIDGYAAFQGKLGDERRDAGRLPEVRPGVRPRRRAAGHLRLLKTAEDTADSTYQRMQGRYMQRGQPGGPGGQLHPPGDPRHPRGQDEASSWPTTALAPYRLLLERLLRYKPHTLGKKEEKLLAMQTEMAQAAGQIFRQLNDADLKFGTVTQRARASGSS